ncbi:site-specific DNA-methyltransferase [Acetobacterium fimetarium]|uniref:Site-specific DNA-methyltransferase n=1 Tax=Acetobacterium fimetarium TaxID=52691 RepID=A0ABR6WSQ5_9FIRM|nr:site-specific DNA-methyltransferase [Acetobacterium fimetarium]
MEYKKVAETINDFANDNLSKLAQLFPAAVKDGEVDFEALKQELGAFKEVGSEKYELTWAGKQNAKKVALEDVNGKTLNYVPEDSKNPETTENLYIEGDNLEVLKLLRQNYYGAIKMIYIDPPYNTGNDFIYNDNFAMSVEESEIAEGNRDELGEKYKPNSKSQNRYHANWLNMMYPRLKMAKDLLTEDGLIFISINDNEVDNLKKICDELFGDQNFVADLIWSNKEGGGSSDSKLFRIKHEHILCYAKNIVEIEIKGVPISNEERYKSSDEFEKTRGKYYLQKLGMGSIQYSESLDYPIEAPDGSFVKPADNNNGRKACWRWSKIKYQWGFANGFIVRKKDSNDVWTIYTKQYLNCDNEGNVINRTQRPMGVIESFSSTQASKLLENMKLGGIFPYSKPIELVKYIIERCYTDDGIILDFFSGSATTAHALMQLNAQDEGINKRKFIMVQIPEKTSENSEANQTGYKNICEIGKERIRRAGDKIIEEKPELKGKLDIGFKVFKVADTNIKWNHQTEIDEQFTVDTAVYTPDLMDFMPGAKDEDIVYEVMLRQNDVPLSSTLETLTDIGQRTYLYASSYLVCLETEITVALVDKLAALNPLPFKFIFRDSAFQDDIALKDETFRRLKALIEKNAGTSKKTYTVEFI